MVIGDWLAPPPSPRRALTVGYDTTRRVGTSIWPPVGTPTWPPVGTFSWPRTPRRASSSTIRPPIDWPTVETPPSPCSRMKSATESVRVAIETSPVNGGVSPNPGRSIAMTSRRSASSSMIGVQDCHPAPRPCTSNSGLPLPRRTWFNVTLGTLSHTRISACLVTTGGSLIGHGWSQGHPRSGPVVLAWASPSRSWVRGWGPIGFDGVLLEVLQEPVTLGGAGVLEVLSGVDLEV